MKDANNTVTTNFADATLIYFNVTLDKRINGYSFAAAEGIVATPGSGATINIRYPANSDPGAVASSAPFDGYFTITCMDSISNPSNPIPVTTRDIHWHTSGRWVSNIINEDIPFLASVTDGWDGITSAS